MAKATIEVEIPDGYEFDRWDYCEENETYFDGESVRIWRGNRCYCKYIIVRKVEPAVTDWKQSLMRVG